MDFELRQDKIELIFNQLENWFSNNDPKFKILHVANNVLSGDKFADFLNSRVAFSDFPISSPYQWGGNKNGILKESPSNLRIIEAARCVDVSTADIYTFIKLVFFTCYLESVSGFPSGTNINKKMKFEQISINKIELLKQIFGAKEELMRVATSDVDSLMSGFRLIYQTTAEDDLSRFDIMYDANKNAAIEEKMEIGLRLMEKGNVLRNESKGQHKTFETSSKKRIVVYFPRPDDNIPDNRYSYPRAAIHTARILSKKMFDNKMSSALGLSIGWGGLMQEQNLKMFFDLITSTEEQLPGINHIKNNDKSIMCLVTIPRVRPHKYLKLSKAEGFIFIVFSIINDLIINMNNKKMNANNELVASFTSDTTSKLSNINAMPDQIEQNKKCIVYACKVCVLNIRRKGVAPAHIMRMMKELLQISLKTMEHPEEFKEDLNMEEITEESDMASGSQI